MQTTKSVKWNEMYKWKDDMKHPGYETELINVPKANVDHTIYGQGIADIGHLATTPKTLKWLSYILICRCTSLSQWFIILDNNNFVKVSHHYLTSGGYQVFL